MTRPVPSSCRANSHSICPSSPGPVRKVTCTAYGSTRSYRNTASTMTVAPGMTRRSPIGTRTVRGRAAMVCLPVPFSWVSKGTGPYDGAHPALGAQLPIFDLQVCPTSCGVSGRGFVRSATRVHPFGGGHPAHSPYRCVRAACRDPTRAALVGPSCPAASQPGDALSVPGPGRPGRRHGDRHRCRAAPAARPRVVDHLHRAGHLGERVLVGGAAAAVGTHPGHGLGPLAEPAVAPGADDP